MDKKIIVVGGLPRSGSTFLRFLLDSSDTVIAGPETNFFRSPLWQTQDRVERVSERLAQKMNIEQLQVERAIVSSKSSIDAYGEIMSLYTKAHNSSKVVYAEKTPSNCHAYDRLAREYEDVYFISTIRNGLDVATSIIKNHPRRSGYWCSIQRYIDDCRAIFSFEHSRHIVWRYEDAILNPIEQAKQIFEFINEPFSEKYLDNMTQPSATRDLSKVNQPKLSQSLSTDWIERWRESKHNERVREFMANGEAMYWLKLSGYEVTGFEK